MQKIFFTLALAIVSTLTFAQDENNKEITPSKRAVLTNKFGANWFITANGGAQVLFGDFDEKGKLKDRIAPAFDFAVGKWFTPGLGLRITYSGMQVKSFNYSPTAYTCGDAENGLYKEKWDMMNLHGDVMFNLTNLICGYKEKRVYNVIPYVGFGMLHSYKGNKDNYFGATFGILNTFRISRSWDFNIELKGLVTTDDFDLTVEHTKRDILATATAGFTYRFGPRAFHRPSKVQKVVYAEPVISEAELEEIRTRLAVLGAENENLKEQLKTPVVVEKTKTEEKAVIAPRAVFFNLGSAVVSPQELVNLGFQADQMKEHPGSRYVVTGYADAATGTAETNKRISLKRAEAVIDALVGTYGIDRNCMRAEAFGGATKFDKVYLNRTVIIEAE